MLTQQEIQLDLRHRKQAAVSWSLVFCITTLAYWIFLFLNRGQIPDERSWMLVLPLVAVLIITSCMGHRRSRPFRTLCPACRKDLSDDYPVLSSCRCCPRCGEHIVEGRPRSREAFWRYHCWQVSRRIRVCLWIWTVVVLALLLLGLVHPDGFRSAIIASWPGVLFAGLCWLSTGSRHYLQPLLILFFTALLAHLCLP